MSHNRQWFTFKNMDSEKPELFIYDDIDDWYGISAQGIVDQIKDIKAADIDVRINCRSGMVFEGTAIYNALRLHKANVHISIEGLAASIATVIAMAGDTVTIAENAMMMIHNPYGWASGDAKDMRKTAEAMDKIADSIAVSYTARTGKTLDEMKALMEEETWFTAAEALEIGLVDQVDEPVKAAACFDLTMFNNTPENFMSRPESKQEPKQKKEPQGKEKTETENSQVTKTNTKSSPKVEVDSAFNIADLCNKAGYPEKAAAFLKAKLTEEQVKNRLADFDEIKNLCKTANLADKATDFIKNDTAIDEVRNELFKLLTADDKTIDNSLTPKNQGLKTTASIDTQAIYSKRNQA